MLDNQTGSAQAERGQPMAALALNEAQAGARGFLSGADPRRLLAEGLAVADAVVVLGSSYVAYGARNGLSNLPLGFFATTLLAAVLLWNVMQISGAYGRGPSGGFGFQMGQVARAWSLVSAALLILAYLIKSSESFSRAWALGWFALALCGFAAIRIWAVSQIQRWQRQGRLARTIAIVDLAGAGGQFVRKLQGHESGAFFVVGLFFAEATAGRRNGISDLVALSRLFRIDEVLVTVSGKVDTDMGVYLRRLGTIPTNVRVCPWIPNVGLPIREVGMLLDSPVLTIYRRPMTGWSLVLKRTEDVCLAGLFTIILAPLMAAIALAVKLDSPGPVLFRQERLGFNNNVIRVCKFRTMKHRRTEEVGVPQARRDDPRVTRVGRFLRRSSLDELPQLLNVLRGDMSLVGPRPHAVAHNEYYAGLIDDYLGRHRVQPGITGWAQVNGLRGETDTLEKMQRRVEFDLAYIDRWSMLFDLRIMLLTVFSLLFDREAY